MNKNKSLQEELKKLRKQIEKTKKERSDLKEANKKLQDEVDSLWAMLDELDKSDIENWTHILDQLKTDTITKALMMSKNKAEA
jgi:predicted nuclease with TOPRIM domain